MLKQSPQTARSKLSVASYDRLIREGQLTDADAVELLEGAIVPKMPHNAPHDSSVYRLQLRLLLLLAPLGWIVRCQSSVSFRTSVPEPDLVVVPGPESRYDRERPAASDVALLVEVSDTTLTRDRETKLPVYARALVPEYWIVNLPEQHVEVYREPRRGRSPKYASRVDYSLGELVPVVLQGQQLGHLPVQEFIPV
jgi:Uma2 family endonuclease